jgi:Na+/H+ antiporter 1
LCERVRLSTPRRAARGGEAPAQDYASRAGQLQPRSSAVVAGLVVGKQLDITFFVWLAVKSGVPELPRGISWRQVCEAGNLTYHRRARLKQVLHEVEPQIEKLRTDRG